MSDSVGNPSSSVSILGATEWLTHVLLGPTATSVAVLAIATVGLLLLTGRIPVARGGSILLGCFVLFSASAIARGIVASVRPAEPIRVSDPVPPAYNAAKPEPAPYDPYAGASLPVPQDRPLIQ